MHVRSNINTVLDGQAYFWGCAHYIVLLCACSGIWGYIFIFMLVVMVNGQVRVFGYSYALYGTLYQTKVLFLCDA